MKKKLDSKNKKTELLHELTLLNYKPVRAAFRRNRWDCLAAYLELKGGLTGVQYETAIAATIKAAQALARIFDGFCESVNCACETMREFAQAFYNLPSLEPWTAETSADILNGNEIKQIFDDEINEGGADNAGI